MLIILFSLLCAVGSKVLGSINLRRLVSRKSLSFLYWITTEQHNPGEAKDGKIDSRIIFDAIASSFLNQIKKNCAVRGVNLVVLGSIIRAHTRS